MSDDPVSLEGRALLLTYDFPPMGGGIARWMGEMALRYPPGTLTVSTARHSGSQAGDARYPNQVDRLDLPGRRLRTVQGLVRWSHRAGRLAKSQGSEFAWCGQLRPAAYPARWLHATTGMPYGIVMHGGDLLTLRRHLHSARKRPVVRTLLGTAATIVANSRWTADLCRSVCDDLGIAFEGRLQVIPLGTDPAVFRPGLDPREARAAFGLPEGRWLITVARLTPHKGIDTGIRCLAALAAEMPDLRYAVIGAGHDLVRLEALARDLAVGHRVHFLGQVGDADLPSLYNLGDVYLGPSRLGPNAVEGFGISIIEASACGLPVVVGNSGGTSEAVRDGETGVLVNAEDPGAFAATVRSLLDDHDQARRMGAAGRRAVETFFNWDRVVLAMRALGRECAEASGPHPPSG